MMIIIIFIIIIKHINDIIVARTDNFIINRRLYPTQFVC